jgi:general stress protein CsbA
MKRSNLFLFLILLLVPGPAAASDPTPLIVLFFGVPFLLCAILFLVICFFARRVGAVLMGLLILAHLPLMGLASETRYGSWLLASLVSSVAGFLVAMVLLRQKSLKDNTELSITPRHQGPSVPR